MLTSCLLTWESSIMPQCNRNGMLKVCHKKIVLHKWYMTCWMNRCQNCGVYLHRKSSLHVLMWYMGIFFHPNCALAGLGLYRIYVLLGHKNVIINEWVELIYTTKMITKKRYHEWGSSYLIFFYHFTVLHLLCNTCTRTRVQGILGTCWDKVDFRDILR